MNTNPSHFPTIGAQLLHVYLVEARKIGREMLNLRNSLIMGQSFHNLETQTNSDTAYDRGWNARSSRTEGARTFACKMDEFRNNLAERIER